MDAIEFINKRIRMCTYMKTATKCEDCPLHDFGCNLTFDDLVEHDKVEEAIQIVEKWSKENSLKTRQHEFLKHWPDASLDRHGVLTLCPKNLYCNFSCIDTNDTENHKRLKNCNICRREFWLQEVE